MYINICVYKESKRQKIFVLGNKLNYKDRHLKSNYVVKMRKNIGVQQVYSINHNIRKYKILIFLHGNKLCNYKL